MNLILNQRYNLFHDGQFVGVCRYEGDRNGVACFGRPGPEMEPVDDLETLTYVADEWETGQ